MGLELKKRSKQFLRDKEVDIELPEGGAERVFGLFDIPSYFGEGKNFFRIKPRVNAIQKGSNIEIEILDANGNPIYWEIPTFKSLDKSRVISVWVYDNPNRKYNTPDGPCEIIIVSRNVRGQTMRARKRVNIVKSRTSESEILFKPNDKPNLQLSSSVETFRDKSQSGLQLTKTTQANQVKYIKSNFGDTISYEATNLRTIVSASFQVFSPSDGDSDFNYVNLDTNAYSIPFFESSVDQLFVYNTSGDTIFLENGSSEVSYALVDNIDLQSQEIVFDNDYEFNGTSENQATWDLQFISNTSSLETNFESGSGVGFNQEMVSGSIELDFSSTTLFPRLTGQSQPTSVTHSITKVVSSNIIRVENPITQSDNRDSDSIHTYEYSDGSVTGTIRYIQSGSDVVTQNQVAIANITLTNVNPIAGRVASINTLIKSQGLASSDFELIANTQVSNDTTIEYKVPIPTEQLKDPKTLKIQFVNSAGDVSTTELIVENIIFEGGNAYIAGDQGLITGSFHIGNSVGTGIEMSGESSGYIKSIGYKGFTSASEGSGPGGFLIWSGSDNLTIGVDDYPGVGMEMISEGGSSSFFFTTHDGGNLKVITDEFFIGNEDTQFISGSGGNIEISSSFFHLNPKDDEAIIGGFVITPTAISSSNDSLILKANGQITGSSVRLVVEVDGDDYEVLDTTKGIIDAKNVGRSLYFSTDEVTVSKTGTSSGATYATPIYVTWQGLKYETQVNVSFQGMIHKSGTHRAIGGIKATLETASSGSENNGDSYYDNWSTLRTITNIGVIGSMGVSSAYTGSASNVGSDSYTFYIDDYQDGLTTYNHAEYQTQIFRLKLEPFVNVAFTGTGTSNVFVKNISLWTSRGLASTFDLATQVPAGGGGGIV
jgi:hypothetical protein